MNLPPSQLRTRHATAPLPPRLVFSDSFLPDLALSRVPVISFVRSLKTARASSVPLPPTTHLPADLRPCSTTAAAHSPPAGEPVPSPPPLDPCPLSTPFRCRCPRSSACLAPLYHRHPQPHDRLHLRQLGSGDEHATPRHWPPPPPALGGGRWLENRARASPARSPSAAGQFEPILCRFDPICADSRGVAPLERGPLKPISAVSAIHKTSFPNSSGWWCRGSMA